MTLSNATQSCPYSRQTGPVGCLPAPNIFPLAKETFAKGKMFWNPKDYYSCVAPSRLSAGRMRNNIFMFRVKINSLQWSFQLGEFSLLSKIPLVSDWPSGLI